MFAGIDLLNQQRNDDRKDTDRPRSETQLLKMATRTILKMLGVTMQGSVIAEVPRICWGAAGSAIIARPRPLPVGSKPFPDRSDAKE